MALKRIYPLQDVFISRGLLQNTGRDEILEIGYCGRVGAETSARILLDFSVKEFTRAVEGLGEYKAILHLYSAVRRNIPATYTLQVYRITETWKEGLGRVTDERAWTAGVSWTSRDGDRDWSQAGGTVGDLITEIVFNENTLEEKGDLEIDVTKLVKSEKLGSILIRVKEEESFFNNGSNLAFFSSNTHTIYRPCVEIVVDDSVRKTCLPELSRNAIVSPINLQESYLMGDKEEIRLGVKPTYPGRRFTTASLYLEKYVLPEKSYWGIKDAYTADMIVDFSEGTKLSADDSGNFFTLDTGLLTSERYLDLLVKTEISGSVHTYKVGSSFRIRRTCQM